MERLNSEGIARDQLSWALTQRSVVRMHRKIDACMLCRRSRVNEAALCDICWVLLDDRESELANHWLTGERT